jgi:fatty-acyl-CoA synthase
MDPLGSTLPERIVTAAGRRGAVTFVGTDPAAAVRVPWADLHLQARRMAVGLQRRGVGPGDRVALLGPTSRPLVTAIQATWLCGATVMVLPLPMRLGSLEEFVTQTRARIDVAEVSVLAIDGDLAAFVEPRPGDPPMVALSELPAPSDDLSDSAPGPDDLAVLQFTSGSTADPKGVMLSHRQVLANLDGVAAAAKVDLDREVIVSWLPLYHDMGLIGLLTIPMITGIDLVLGSPQDFMTAPARWVEWMSRYRGTATAGPNFSYALAARALNRLSGLDLSPWRVALNGAEPVDPATVQAFVDAGAAHGLHPGAAFPAFGMAEVAIAGTLPEPGAGLRVDVVDRHVLETEHLAAPAHPDEGARSLVLLGRPIPGLHIRVCDPHSGQPLDERQVGELQISGSSLSAGYYKHPTATAAAFDDGWLKTGDLSYLVDGELVVCGRLQDMITVAGRNVFPEDVERAVAAVDGVRAGNVIAFGVEGRPGKEAMVVVAETKSDDRVALRRAVASQVLRSVGVAADEVVLVAPGSLPKTSSGKLQRSLCRRRYLGAELEMV